MRPWLVETCVHGERPGTSYQAAGWQCVGHTRGRPPGTARGAAVEPKAVWLRGLQEEWQSQLCQPLERQLGQYPELVLADEASWAQLEQVGQSWERQAGEDLPAIFPHPTARRAATRLLHNERVSAEDILQPHREALLERVQEESMLLLVQDTTTLNYTNLKACTSGPGPLKERSSSARGLFVHAALGLTAGGRPPNARRAPRSRSGRWSCCRPRGGLRQPRCSCGWCACWNPSRRPARRLWTGCCSPARASARRSGPSASRVGTSGAGRSRSISACSKAACASRIAACTARTRCASAWPLTPSPLGAC